MSLGIVSNSGSFGLQPPVSLLPNSFTVFESLESIKLCVCKSQDRAVSILSL